jgi:hypothetical protein
MKKAVAILLNVVFSTLQRSLARLLWQIILCGMTITVRYSVKIRMNLKWSVTVNATYHFNQEEDNQQGSASS